MEIKATFALCLVLGFSLPVFGDAGSMWQDVKQTSAKSIKSSKQKSNNLQLESSYKNARLLQLDLSEMSSRLQLKQLAAKGIKSEKSKTSKKTIELPLPDGRLISVSIAENNLLPNQLRNNFPTIKTLNVLPDDVIASGKLDLSSNGFHAILQTRQGETVFIDPIKDGLYASYLKSDQRVDGNTAFTCSAHSEAEDIILESSRRSAALKTSGRTFKSLINYRIAVAATGEYTAKHGGTVASAMSAITTTINRVNQVFEQDLGIHLTLVANNDQLVYVDKDSDPYYAKGSKELLLQNQSNIDAVIGSENYDIGHLFTTSGGGLAAIASTCRSTRKAQGVSGIANPRNDSFNLDFVAHEIGHQFGATHTFNGVQGLCSGNTRSATTAFEPGSGSTIMSYAGFCGGDNLQTNTDAMFHIGSIQQIRSYVESGSNDQCGVANNVSNTSPQVDAGANYIIPAQTPFELKGEAIDAEGDNLIYSWQQVDAGELSPVNADRGNNALFRAHPLSDEKNRTFPPMQSLLNHANTRGEILPVQQRIIKFKLVVQDSYNTTQSDAMKILVRRTGSRFALNMPRSQYRLGETHKVLWNVADTDQQPVNCSNVDISLSVDGGYHFDQSLGENLPNTGVAWVTIPPTLSPTSRGRFKILCSDNIFFAVSYRNFSIDNQPHSDRQILTDEDMPEPELDDYDLIKLDVTKYVEPSTAEAGGVLDWFWALLLLLPASRSLRFKLLIK